MAFLGIVAGMFGASVIFWEARLNADDVGRVTRSIMQSGQQLNLTKGDWRSLIGMTIFSIIVAGLLWTIAWSVYQKSGNGWRLSGQIQLITFLFVAIPFAAHWYYIKNTRRWFYQSANFLRTSSSEQQERFVKDRLRFIALGCLLVAGFLQIPMILWGN